MPEHKTAGDSLTVLQEYRGFILGGGGYDWNGANPHNGGHKRLSAVYKELLMEVDIMEGITFSPPNGLKGILNNASKGFSDKTDGAGILMYWIIDEDNLPNTIFATYQDAIDFMTAHRNAALSTEFIHLIFADDHNIPGLSKTAGFTVPNMGSYAFVDQAQPFAIVLGGNVTGVGVLNKIVTHEPTHLIIDAINAVGWDDLEHVLDPNEDGNVDNNDKLYLMFKTSTQENHKQIKFCNPSRRQIDLNTKEGVERR